jgi:UDP-glucose 4-epimerase
VSDSITIKQSKRCIITGSEGFVGQYVVKKFLDEGYIVLGIDNLSKYGVRKVPEHERYSLFEYDLTQLKPSDGTWISDRRPDVIIDLAEDVGGINYLNQNATEKLYSSLTIRRNMLNATPRSCRYICISSSAVYERINTFPTPEIDVVDLPTPVSPYALTKMSAEYISQYWGGNLCVARLFNVAGTGDDHLTKGHAIADLVRKFKNCGGKPVGLVGDGQQTRNFVHGEDVAEALYLIATKSLPGQIYNVGSHNNIKIADLAHRIAIKFGMFNGMYKVSANPAYNINTSIPNIYKLEKLGYSPKWDIDRILDEAVEYYA